MSQRQEIAYDVPEGFVEEEVEGVTVVSDNPKYQMAFFIKRCDPTNAASAVSELEGVLGIFFQNPQVPEEPAQGTYNGIPGTELHGTATFQEKPVSLTIRWLQPSDNVAFSVTGAVLTDQKDKLQQTFDTFLGSIRRA
jgi:hypothetical protein